MSPVDWDSDPELKALRDEFVASFAERRRLLSEAITEIARAPGASPQSALESLRFVAHKLAGAAESYGFSSLTEASAALEELLDEAVERGLLLRSARLLLRMLESAEITRSDPGAIKKEAEFKELLGAAARRGSS